MAAFFNLTHRWRAIQSLLDLGNLSEILEARPLAAERRLNDAPSGAGPDFGEYLVFKPPGSITRVAAFGCQ